MSKFRYNLYCDESAIDQGQRFYIGGIHCSPARAKLLERKVQDFRGKTGCVREMKWTKVSSKMLLAYIDFVDIFLNDIYATFILAEMHKGEHWYKFARSEGSRFLQAYFQFFENAMWASARYELYLDDTTCKRYKWGSMHYALNLPDIKWAKQKKVVGFYPLDSHKSDLIQLTDVLLGALTSSSVSEPKIKLSEHVRSQIERPTEWGKQKISTFSWTAPESPRFKPNV